MALHTYSLSATATAPASLSSGQDSEFVVATFQAKADQLKMHDDAKTALLQEVIQRYHHVVKTYGNAIKEREAERKFLASFTQQTESLENTIRMLQNFMNKDPFILCIIDGDGFLFSDHLLRDGLSGGERAATLLRQALLEWSHKHIQDIPPDTRVVVRVYAHLSALVEICIGNGLATSPDVLEDFFQGLMLGDALFDFVDVGERKGNAALKVMAQFKLHLMDMHCRQIFLACSHTNTYTQLLASAAKDDPEQTLARVTLLEGAPFTDEVAALKYPKAKLPGIFLHSQLYSVSSPPSGAQYRIGTAPDNRGLSGASQSFTPRTHTPYTPASFSPQSAIPELPLHPHMNSHPHIRSDSTSSSLLSISDAGINGPCTGAWAKIAKSSATLPLTDLTLRPQSTPQEPTTIRRNRKGQRIDEPLSYERDEVQALKKLKYCNQHFIGQGCCHYNAGKADKCPHRHDGALSARQKMTLRVVARETPCKRGSACDDARCIYGHRCPFPMATEGTMRGIGCLNGEHCRFPRDMHGLDMISVVTTRVTGAF